MPIPIPTASPLILSTHLRGAEPRVEIIVLIFQKGKCKLKGLRADGDGEDD